MEPLSLVISAAIVAAVIGLYVWGYSTESGSAPPTINPGTNSADANCEAACAQWNTRRAERCLAQSDFAAADAALKAAQADYWGAEAAAISLLAAAIALASNPFTAAFAVAAFVVFAAAQAYAVKLLGRLNAASANFSAKAAALSLAFQRQQEARDIVVQACGPNAPCLLTPGPC